MKKIFIISVLSLCFSNIIFGQLKIDASGNTVVKFGTFSTGNDAALFLGDYNHYIKSKFGVGVSIGTYGSAEAIVIPQSSGKVGIFRTPSYCLDVNGQIRSTQALIVSDERYKTNVNPLTKYSSKIYDLNPVSYSYKPNSFNNSVEFDAKLHFGFLQFVA
jgi:hypothetical protein